MVGELGAAHATQPAHLGIADAARAWGSLDPRAEGIGAGAALGAIIKDASARGAHQAIAMWNAAAPSGIGYGARP